MKKIKSKNGEALRSQGIFPTHLNFPTLKVDYIEVNKEIKGYLDMGCIITYSSVEDGVVKLEDHIGELSQWKPKGKDSLKERSVKANLVLE